MSKTASLFKSVASIDIKDESDLTEDSNGDSGKHVNELADSFQAFIEGRYGEASEVRFELLQKFV